MILSSLFIFLCLQLYSQSLTVEDFTFTVSNNTDLAPVLQQIESHFNETPNFEGGDIRVIETFINNTLLSFTSGTGEYAQHIDYRVFSEGNVSINLNSTDQHNVSFSHYDLRNEVLINQDFYGRTLRYSYDGYEKDQLHIIAAISFDRLNLNRPGSINFIITDMDKL